MPAKDAALQGFMLELRLARQTLFFTPSFIFPSAVRSEILRAVQDACRPDLTKRHVDGNGERSCKTGTTSKGESWGKYSAMSQYGRCERGYNLPQQLSRCHFCACRPGRLLWQKLCMVVSVVIFRVLLLPPPATNYSPMRVKSVTRTK